MTEEQTATRETANRLAARLQAFAEALAEDERALLATVVEQAAAHPDAIVQRTAEPEVTGFYSYFYFGFGVVPPPLGGVGVGGYPNWYYYFRY